MGNRIITMESLVELCKSTGTFSYNANETGHPLVVSISGKLQFSSEDDDLMDVALKSCHIGLNRNGSYISEKNMKRAVPSFANKPILAEIVTNSDGVVDFGTHAAEEIEDENGNKKIHYIERPVGIVPESYNPRFVYDKKQDKTYLLVDGKIFKLYGNETAEILERKKGTKVSIEIDISSMAWDAKNKWLDIIDFKFSGVTLLGEDVGEGMLGARCDISEFAQYESFDYTKEIEEMKSRLAFIEARYKNSKEGGNQELGKLEELLAQYNVKVEDLDFDYEGMSDEELEAKFKEVFGENEPDTSSGEENDSQVSNTSTSESESESNSTFESESETPSEPETGMTPGSKADDDDVAGTSTKKKNNDFALSLQEKINALSNLVATTYEEADNEWYCTLVYEEYVVMIGYWKGQAYRQNYKCENDVYTLVGDRVQVYEQFLTQEEMDALESMKANYAELQQFKANIEQKELEEARTSLINDERFELIKETDDYKELVKEIEKYSVDELETKLKLIVADKVLQNGNFAAFSEQGSGRMFRIPSKETNPIETKYGGIFDEHE